MGSDVVVENLVPIKNGGFVDLDSLHDKKFMKGIFSSKDAA